MFFFVFLRITLTTFISDHSEKPLFQKTINGFATVADLLNSVNKTDYNEL